MVEKLPWKHLNGFHHNSQVWISAGTTKSINAIIVDDASMC